MYKLLKINNVEFPDPKGAFSISKTDKVNEYECEDGSKVVELVREGIISTSVNYGGLTIEQMEKLTSALKVVSNVEYFDAFENKIKTISAKIDSVKTSKVAHRGNVSVWSLSFNINEL